jgi:MFS family permease
MWYGKPAMAGPILGPPLAGFILSITDWPWIFFVNVPIGMLGMLGVAKFVPRITQPDPGPFDVAGFFLSAGAIGGVMVLVETLDYSVALQLTSAAVAVVTTALYLMHSARRTRSGLRPIVDLGILKYPTFRLSCVGGAICRLGVGGSPYLLAILLQVGLGWTPLQAGSVATASAIGALMSRPIGPGMIRYLGFRRMLWTTAVAMAVLGALPGVFDRSTPIPIVVAILGLTGLMRASHFGAVNALGFADIPPDRVSASSTLLTMMQQISLSLGVTVASLTLHLASHGSKVMEPRTFIMPFVVLSALGLLAVPFYLRLKRDAGADIVGGRRRG